MGQSDPRSNNGNLEVELEEPDLARNMFGSLYDVSHVDVHPDDQGEFSWEWNVAIRGPATLIRGIARSGQATVAGTPPFYVFSLVEEGAVQMSFGAKSVDVVPNMSAAIVNAEAQVSAFTHPGTRTFNLRIDPRALSSHLEAMVGMPINSPITFDLAVDLRHGNGADMVRLTQLLSDAAAHPATPLGSPHVIAHVREALFGLLLTGQKHSASHFLHRPVPITNARVVKAAEEIIDARATEPISIAEVADLVGISLRSLERSYKEARGQTLRDFLKSRRLELAHRRLAAATPGTTVTQVLYASGFSHPGEFSRVYRERFGMAPSETLRRALRSETTVAKSR